MSKPPRSSNSKSEDTSLDDLLSTLTDDFRRWLEPQLLAWHKAEVAKLLQVIEDEVIGEDVKYKNSSRDSDQLANSKKRSRNALKAEQRQALKKIKDNVINGGSL